MQISYIHFWDVWLNTIQRPAFSFVSVSVAHVRHKTSNLKQLKYRHEIIQSRLRFCYEGMHVMMQAK